MYLLNDSKSLLLLMLINRIFGSDLLSTMDKKLTLPKLPKCQKQFTLFCN